VGESVNQSVSQSVSYSEHAWVRGSESSHKCSNTAGGAGAHAPSSGAGSRACGRVGACHIRVGARRAQRAGTCAHVRVAADWARVARAAGN
jgi:hypothetical protein